MKILFFPSSCIPFNAKTLDDRPLGGTETGVIRLSEELQSLGHEVIVATSEENPPLSSPLYIPTSGLRHLGQVDVMVGVRGWQTLFMELPSTIKLFWTGDSYDQVACYGIGDGRFIDRVDGLLCVSNWHKKTLSLASGFPDEKTFNLKNGIHLKYFNQTAKKRHPKRLIYSSTPYRGLKFLPEIFKKILKKHPDSELLVCSGFDVYKGAGPTPQETLQEYEETKKQLEAIPECRFVGNITQKELAQEFLGASILCYPNTFEETSCITVLEAKAAGCIPITSKRAALSETVGKGGILIDGEPGEAEYTKAFVNAVDDIFNSDSTASELRTIAQKEASQQGWDAVAHNFISILQEIVGRRSQ